MKASTRLKIIAPLVAVTILLSLLAYFWLGSEPRIQVAVNYEINQDLPPGSTLVVELRDDSSRGSSGDLLIRRVVVNPGSPPHSLEVAYGSLEIDEAITYSLGVRVEGPNNELFFVNDTTHKVITQGNPQEVTVELVQVLELP